MNLCFSSHVLLAGLFLSVSALTPEECQPMVRELPLDDLSVILGRHNSMLGYSNHEAMNRVLAITESSWMNIFVSPNNPNEVEVNDVHRMAQNCMETSYKMTVQNNTISFIVTNTSSVYRVLPSGDSCVIFSGTSTIKNFDKFLQMLGIDMSVGSEEVHIHDAYLICREETLKESDKEHFKQQASCLGFSGEPNFQYNPDKGFCKEGEGIKVDLFES